MRKLFRGIASFALVATLFCVWAFHSFEPEDILTNAGTVSNKKIAWGVKREKDHKQPDFGKTNAELMEKYDCIYVGNKEQKYVYLTFDQGYEAGYTEKILDTLKEKEVKATFFVTAHYVNSASEIVKRMIDERTYCAEIIQLITNVYQSWTKTS